MHVCTCTCTPLLQGNCIEAVKAKAIEILDLAPKVHADAITRLVRPLTRPSVRLLVTTLTLQR